jgi:hypothetical protein
MVMRRNDMKLIDMIKKVDRSESNCSWVNVEDLCFAFAIEEFWPEDNKLWDETFKAYSLSEWTCTDTAVGLQVLEVHGVVVGITWQPYRKSNVEFRFLSKDKADYTKEILLSFKDEDNINYYLLTDSELEEDWSETYIDPNNKEHKKFHVV